ncbi:MAG: cupin domain-containing protein [Thermoplasmata archaeon]|nr:cupin domain-containing protein [Thermoplasmata archaeon]
MANKNNGLVKSYKEIQEMEMEGGARIRWLITHKDGAPTFSMRYISIDKGKETPAHSHDYEHEIFVLHGKGEVTIGNEKKDLEDGKFIYIPPTIFHKIHANEDMTVICVVPIKAAKQLLGD